MSTYPRDIWINIPAVIGLNTGLVERGKGVQEDIGGWEVRKGEVGPMNP